MREILFRGKRIDNGEWVDGFYSPLIWYPSLKQTPSIKSFKGGDMEINPETLGQYTGLKDKNGTKIFEGDILEFEFVDIGKHLAIVEYCQEYATFLLNPTGDFWFSLIKDGKVIGNIYDNPELLEEA